MSDSASDLKVPEHIAIIMDGNGRWAKERGKQRHEGHRVGAKVVKETVQAASDLGVKYLTLYAFSTENWKRPKLEINALMTLLEQYLKAEIQDMCDKGVRLRAMGRIDLLPSKIQKLLNESMELTKDNSKIQLILALSYGGRQEIVDATKKIANHVQEGLNPDEITEELINKSLYLPDVPNPELLIRTSNEQRISNFLLWQLSYAEFVFIPELWPEFGPEKLKDCIEEYNSRGRRFGDVA